MMERSPMPSSSGRKAPACQSRIAPGMVQTVLSEYYWKDESRWTKMMAAQPVKHLGQPNEIAESRLSILASDSGSLLTTRQTIVVDGARLLSSM